MNNKKLSRNKYNIFIINFFVLLDCNKYIIAKFLITRKSSFIVFSKELIVWYKEKKIINHYYFFFFNN